MAAKPLVVIVGETGSGKSALALELAKQFNGEIICADSRTVYKGMNIGTAKPSAEDRRQIPHHLLDVVEPNESFNVAQFKQLAMGAVDEIQSRSRLPIMVGGSGLYIDAVIFDYKFNRLGAERDSQNPRHLQKTGQPQPKASLRADTLVIGLKVLPEVLKQRLKKRVDQMVNAGLVEEVKRLGQKYGWEAEALRAPGYRAFREHLAGNLSIEEAKSLFVQYDLALAKKQRTWFKRNKSIHWLDDPKKAVEILTTFLNTKQR